MTQNIEINDTEKEILNSIRELKYGSIEVVVHDAKIVQLQKSERIRFDKKSA